MTPAIAAAAADVIRERLLDEIGDCAAYTPARQRAAFATLLRGIAGVLRGKRGDCPPERLAIDARVREALGLTVTSLAEGFPGATAWIAEVLEVCADFARDGKIPMGTRRLPRARRSGHGA